VLRTLFFPKNGVILFERQGWMSQGDVDWLRTVALCLLGTLLSVVALDVLKPSIGVTSPIVTIAWWFAFSISLYWSEMSGSVRETDCQLA
jgi:hypothetical protein